MLVKYSIQTFPGKGKGMVAEEFIPQGKLVWQFNAKNAKVFSSKEQLVSFLKDCPDESRLHTLEFVYGMAGQAILMQDDSQFMNHSKHPNVASNDAITENFASRDIQSGEEITIDYLRLHVVDWLEEVCEEFGTDTTKDVESYE